MAVTKPEPEPQFYGSSDRMQWIRYYYRYGMRLCFAGLLVFTVSTYVGYIYAQLYAEQLLGMEVKITFGKSLMTLDYMLRDPMVNIPWERVGEDSMDTFQSDKTVRTFIVMESDDVKFDLRLLNAALRKLRESHVTKTQSRDRMTWHNNPRNFHTLDIAKGEYARYMTTIVPHSNVLTLLYQSTTLSERTPVQYLKVPVKRFYQWTTSSKLCREIKDNTRRFKSTEDTCLNHVMMNSSIEALDSVETSLILNGQAMQNYPLYIHLISGGLIDSLGNVYTGSLLMIPLGCDQRLPFEPSTDWKIYAEVTIEEEVFVMTQFFDNDPNAFMIDGLPRIVPYLKFLWDHKGVKVHVSEKPLTATGQKTREMLAILGIDETRLVRGHVKSETIYLAQGGGCGAPSSLPIQTLAQLYHQHINTALGVSDKTRNTILIINSDDHIIHDFSSLVAHAQEFAQKYSMEVEILAKRPALHEAMMAFYQAAIVVGSANSAMANILFCQPGTVVIEVLCSVPYMTLGHLKTAYSLGLRYHAIPGNIGCSSGIVLDMFAARNVLEFYTSRFNMFHE